MNVKDQIADIFLELVRKKSVDKITVRDIVEKCGITRQSFYYHFSDIFNLIEWIMQRECSRLLADVSGDDTPEQCAKKLLKSRYENRRLIKRLTNTKELETVEKIIINTVRAFLIKIADPYKTSNVSAAELDMTLDFYSFAVAGFIMGLHGRNDTDVERASAQLLKLLRGQVQLTDA